MTDSGAKARGWKKINYKQDLPPPGGYGRIPYIRNLPVRGPGGYTLLAMAGLVLYNARKVIQKNRLIDEAEKVEHKEAEMALVPLLEAEYDRAILRDYKEMMESEALNIVGTGYDPDHVPGQDVYNIKRWREPFFPDKIYQIPTAINFFYDSVFRKDVPGP